MLVHQAFFVGNRVPFLFINVVNLSRDRDVELTHVWFDVEPSVHVVLADRALPVRLRPDESWEAWTEWGKLAEYAHPETRARVRLSTGKVIKSRMNPSVPPMAFVPGGPRVPPGG